MVEFREGDWVTIGGDDYCTPGKKYQIMSDEVGDLYFIDDDGYERYWPLVRINAYKTKKTTPFIPPEKITAHGRTYRLQHPKGHEWKFPQ